MTDGSPPSSGAPAGESEAEVGEPGASSPPPGAAGEVSPASSAPQRTPVLPGPRWLAWGLLAAAIATFSVITFEVAWASYANITPGGIGGSTDLAIMMQALSSTAHGYIPFFESPDCVHTGRCSLLLVHPALMLYALVPVYELSPTPALLFALQALGVALAAVPLYLLATDLGRSRWNGLVAAVAYLVFLPTISSIDFSFHVEPFLPLELFTLFWLWRGQRYWIGGVVAVVSMVTFEVNSVLIFFFGVFFLWPYAVGWVRSWTGSAGATDETGIAKLLRQIQTFLFAPSGRVARAAVILMVLAVGGYLVLRFFVENSTLFGLPSLPSRYLLPVTRPNPQLNFALVFGGSAARWLFYWLFAFALLGFVGLLVPRTLWLAVPWLAYTALATSPNYTTLGLHYGGIAAIPLLIGFAYGLAKLPLARRPPDLPVAQRSGYRAKRAASWALVVVVIAVNLAFTPLSPLAVPLAQSGLPVYSEYPSTLSAQPGAVALQELGNLVPQRSALFAPYLLLPFVANDPYAVPYPRGNTAYLPFSFGTLPTYVLTDPTDIGGLPSAVQAAIYNTSEYGSRAVVPVTALGMVTLFERNYTGPTTVLGASGLSTLRFSPTELRVAGNATGLVATASTPYGVAIQSKPASVVGNLLFSTPKLTIVPDDYTLTVDLWVQQTNASAMPVPDFLVVNVTGYSGTQVLSVPLAYANYAPGSWFAYGTTVDLASGMYQAVVTGALTTAGNAYQVECASLTLAPA